MYSLQLTDTAGQGSTLPKVKVKVKVSLRLTVNQSVCLCVGHPFAAHDQSLHIPFFCLKIALLFVFGRPL
jgi:hypothetical protein